MAGAELTTILIGATLAFVLARAALHADGRARARRLRTTAWRLPDGPRAVVATRLVRAELAIEPEAALRWWGLGIGAVGWFALVVVPALVVPAVVAAISAGPIGVRLRSGRADRAARAALPGVLDHVVAHLRAGGTVPDAVEGLASRAGPLAADFRRIAARGALGASIDEALAAWRIERPIDGVAAAAGALAMVATVGGSAATPLEGLAASLRNDEAAAGEARALAAQARISAVVVGAAPLAFLAFSAATDPSSINALVASNVGRVCLGLGLVLEALAAWWMHRLVGAQR